MYLLIEHGKQNAELSAQKWNAANIRNGTNIQHCDVAKNSAWQKNQRGKNSMRQKFNEVKIQSGEDTMRKKFTTNRI